MSLDMSRELTLSPEQAARYLEESLATLEWAVAGAPARWHAVGPTWGAEERWGVAMNLAHLVVYEERVAAPIVEALLAGGDAADAVHSAGEDWLDREARALSQEPLDHILARLRTVRARQVAAARAFPPARFNAPATPHWRGAAGTPLKSAAWVLAKTVQHTWEHGCSVMQLALFAPP